MGGCYGGSYDYRPAQRTVEKPRPKWQGLLRKFAAGHEQEKLLDAYKDFFANEKSGFFAKLAAASGISNVKDIPKEFSDIEYEVKFDIQPSGKGKEPSIKQYLDAFDFPPGSSARFLKDPVNTVAEGVNHFIGDSLDEKLVIIEKGGKTFLKEKGRVTPTNTGVPYEEVVIKRTELRYESPLESILEKVHETTSEEGVKYRGRIRKEKGDAFILDTNDGRIYSMSFTRAHLIKAGEGKESATQRQLEMEYAGYIPGFPGFQKNSEKQIVQGMVELAKYTFALYNNGPIASGWRMQLSITDERKYDFVSGRQLPARSRELDSIKGLLEAPKEAVKKR